MNCVWFGDTCAPEGGMDIGSAITGGNNITITISEENMENSKLRFYVMDEGNPARPEDIAPGISHVRQCQAAPDGNALTQYNFYD